MDDFHGLLFVQHIHVTDEWRDFEALELMQPIVQGSSVVVRGKLGLLQFGESQIYPAAHHSVIMHFKYSSEKWLSPC